MSDTTEEVKEEVIVGNSKGMSYEELLTELDKKYASKIEHCIDTKMSDNNKRQKLLTNFSSDEQDALGEFTADQLQTVINLKTLKEKEIEVGKGSVEGAAVNEVGGEGKESEGNNVTLASDSYSSDKFKSGNTISEIMGNMNKISKDFIDFNGGIKSCSFNTPIKFNNPSSNVFAVETFVNAFESLSEDDQNNIMGNF